MGKRQSGTRPVDEKIVSLKMDNSDFEKRARQSAETFAKMQNSIANGNQKIGFFDKVRNGLNRSTKDMSNAFSATAEQSLNSLARRFSITGQIIQATIARVTNGVITKFKMMTNSLGIGMSGIMDGFSEYEIKMNSIKIIMANTARHGTTMKDVTEALDELNKYADLTIYNFGQMTDNIGKFTAAGVNLKDSVTAIKGMANYAAISGATNAQYANAVYQMSQALASGQVQLMDWRSLVNSNMAGTRMQEELIKTAQELGKQTVFKDKKGEILDFRESLSKGWLTTEVFIKTMKKFANDPEMLEAATKIRTFTQLIGTIRESIGSGWGKSFEYIFGDFDESGKLFTKINDVISGFIDRTSDARNAWLKMFKDLGGRNNILETLVNVFQGIGKVLKTVGEAFQDVFKSKGIRYTVYLTEKIKEFSSKLIMTEETTNKVKKVFVGMWSAISIVVTFVKGAIGGILKGLDMLNKSVGEKSLASYFLDGLVKVADFVKELDEAFKAGHNFWGILYQINQITDGFLTGPINMLKTFTNYISNAVSTFSSKHKILSEVFSFKSIKQTWDGLINILKNVFNWIKTNIINAENIEAVIDSLFHIIDKSFESIWKVINKLSITKILKIGIFYEIFKVFKKLYSLINNGEKAAKGISFLTKNINKLVKSLSPKAMTKTVVGTITRHLEKMAKKINVFKILAIAAAITMLAWSMREISKLNPKQIAVSLTTIAASIGLLIGSLYVSLRMMNDLPMGNIKGSFGFFIGLSVSLLIIASAFLKLSKIPQDRLGQVFAVVFGLITTLVGVALLTSKLNAGKPVKVKGFIGLAFSLLIISAAFSKLAKIPKDDLNKALAASLIVYGMITSISLLGSKLNGGKPVKVKGFIGLSISLVILGFALAKIGKIPTEDLNKAILVIGAITLIFVGINNLPKASFMKLGFSLGNLGVALTILSGGLYLFNKLDPKQTISSIGLISLLTLSLGILSRTLKATKTLSLMGVALALNLLIPPLLLLSLLDYTTMLKVSASLVTFGIALAVFGQIAGLGAKGLLLIAPGLLAISAACVLLSGSLFVLALSIGVIAKLSTSSLKDLAEGVAIILKVFKDLIVGLAKIAVEGLVEIVKSITKQIGTFIKLGGTIILKLLDGLFMYLPLFIQKGVYGLTAALISFADSVIKNADIIAKAVKRAIMAILLVVVRTVAELFKGLFGWIIPGLNSGLDKGMNSLQKKVQEMEKENLGGLLKKRFNDQFNKEGGPKLDTSGLEIPEELKNQEINITETTTKKTEVIAEPKIDDLNNINIASTEGQRIYIQEYLNKFYKTDIPYDVNLTSKMSMKFETQDDWDTYQRQEMQNILAKYRGSVDQALASDEWKQLMNRREEVRWEMATELIDANQTDSKYKPVVEQERQLVEQQVRDLKYSRQFDDMPVEAREIMIQYEVDMQMNQLSADRKKAQMKGQIQNIVDDSTKGIEPSSAGYLGASIIEYLARGINQNGYKPESELKDSLDNLPGLTGVIGKNTNASFLSGLKSRSAWGSGYDLGQQSKSGMSSGGAGSYDQGINVGQGFINGIRKKTYEARQAGIALGAASIFGIGIGTDSHSPSREAGKMGDYVGQGFINHLQGFFEKTKTIGTNLGQKAIQGLEVTKNLIQDLVENDWEFSPVISPQIDYASLNMAKNRLSSTFGSLTQTGGMVAGVSKIENHYHQTIENQGMFEGATLVIREEADIKKLAKSIQNEIQLQRNLQGRR